MAIRRRLRRALIEGIPAPEFKGYVRRFGEVYAVFYNAEMLHVTGLAPDVRMRPAHDSAKIIFATRTGVEQMVLERFESTAECGYLHDIIKRWPTEKQARKLPSHLLAPMQ